MKRQGDILLTKVDSIPQTAKLDIEGVLVYGEKTGHKHKVVGGKLYRDKDTMFVKVDKKAKIIHEEHKPLNLSKGKYSVIRQKEYLKKDMTTLVVD